MSAKATFWAWAQELPKTEKLLLLAIADNADDKGYCYPGYEHLKKKTGIHSDATISKALKSLEKREMLVAKRRSGRKNGKPCRFSNQYILPIETSYLTSIAEGSITSGNEVAVTSKNEVAITSIAEDAITSGNEEESNNKSNKEPNKNMSKKSSAPQFNDRDLECSKFMFAAVQEVAPKTKQPDFDSWAGTIRLMRERDHHTHEEIWQVFTWANRDHFWRTNILCPAKLRDKFARLHAESCKPQAGKRSNREHQNKDVLAQFLNQSSEPEKHSEKVLNP